MFSRRILCIDDHDNCALNRRLLTEIDENFQITSVSRPQEAIDLLKLKLFDLYVLEYRLPEMDGVELCKIIRATDPETPILFFSGMARKIDRERALAAGANAYLIKPDDLNIFADTVRRLFNAAQQSFYSGTLK